MLDPQTQQLSTPVGWWHGERELVTESTVHLHLAASPRAVVTFPVGFQSSL